MDIDRILKARFTKEEAKLQERLNLVRGVLSGLGVDAETATAPVKRGRKRKRSAAQIAAIGKAQAARKANIAARASTEVETAPEAPVDVDVPPVKRESKPRLPQGPKAAAQLA